MNHRSFPVALVLFLAFFAPFEVYPYIDAGTGSYMLQLFVAGVVGSLFALKIFFRRIVNGFRKLSGRSGLPEREEKK